MKFLSFDCAIKTLGYTICEIKKINLNELYNENDLNSVLQTLKSLITITHKKTIDISADDDINIIRNLCNYVEKNIYPIIDQSYTVLMELQMNPNQKSKMIEISLMTLFAKYNIKTVGSSLKNKVALTEHGRYYHFAKKYSRKYANKKHCIYNFSIIEKLFTTTNEKSDSHIADSFMQVLGYIIFSTKNSLFL